MEHEKSKYNNIHLIWMNRLGIMKFKFLFLIFMFFFLGLLK